MKILAVIPARGGSKGIPGKNLKSLGGKPLIDYSIEAAKASVHFDSILVSSDNEEIISHALNTGVEAPFIRPAHLAADNSPTLPVIQHALKFYNERQRDFDAVCLLQPTSPFRTTEFIDQAIATFLKSGTDSLISVKQVPHHYNPHWLFKLSEPGKLELFTADNSIISRRQDLPEVFYRDGLIYLTKTSVITEQDSLYGSSVGYITSEGLPDINLDSPADWQRAEQLISNKGGI